MYVVSCESHSLFAFPRWQHHIVSVPGCSVARGKMTHVHAEYVLCQDILDETSLRLGVPTLFCQFFAALLFPVYSVKSGQILALQWGIWGLSVLKSKCHLSALPIKSLSETVEQTCEEDLLVKQSPCSVVLVWIGCSSINKPGRSGRKFVHRTRYSCCNLPVCVSSK